MANETVAEVQAKRELTRAYADLGEKAFTLASSGAITHPDLTADVDRVRALQAKLAEDGGANAGAPAA